MKIKIPNNEVCLENFELDKKEYKFMKLGWVFTNYYSAVIPQSIWDETSSDLYKQLNDYKQYHTWPDLALLPHQHKCGTNIVDIPKMNCNCNKHSEKNKECLAQKAEFTASLLAVRIFCSNIYYYGSKFTRESLAESDHSYLTLPPEKYLYLLEYDDMLNISVFTMAWISQCRKLAFDDSKNETDKFKYDVLDYCLTIIQKCTDFTYTYPSKNKKGGFDMNSSCLLTEDEYKEILIKFKAAYKLEKLKVGVKIGSGLVNVACFITTVATSGLAAPVTGPIALLNSSAAYGGDKMLEERVNKLKDNQKAVTFGTEDALALGGIGLNVIGIGIASNLLDMAPGVHQAYNIANYSETSYELFKLHENVRKGEDFLTDFSLKEMEDHFSMYSSKMTNKLFDVVIKTMNVLNNEKHSTKYFMVDSKIAHYSLDTTSEHHASIGFHHVLDEMLIKAAKVTERNKIKYEKINNEAKNFDQDYQLYLRIKKAEQDRIKLLNQK